jgi:ElaA protein
VAYSRLFAPGYYFDNASIGRVIVKADFRDKKFGHDLMKKAIETIEKAYNTQAITISAQQYLKKFYESHGFVQTSEMYLEDDIPHIEMKRID